MTTSERRAWVVGGEEMAVLVYACDAGSACTLAMEHLGLSTGDLTTDDAHRALKADVYAKQRAEDCVSTVDAEMRIAGMHEHQGDVCSTCGLWEWESVPRSGVCSGCSNCGECLGQDLVEDDSGELDCSDCRPLADHGQG